MSQNWRLFLLVSTLLLHTLNLAALALCYRWLDWAYACEKTAAELPFGQGKVDFRRDFHPKRKTWPAWLAIKPYTQVFEGFEKDMSILDLLFNLGPEAGIYLRDAFVGAVPSD